jgi:hypothetical protein
MSPGLADVPYASKTAPRADPRHKQNQQTDHGVRCWFAPEDVQGDKKLHEQIDEAVHLYDKLLLILSDASIASSWVQRGIRRAHQREVREGRRMLFPIRLVSYAALQEWECW